MMNLIYFLVCILATTVGAISGIGGGVIIKPVMDAISGLPVAAITFGSGCTVLAMSTVSLLRTGKGGTAARLEPRRGTLIALGGAAGGIVGKQLFELVKQAAGQESTVGLTQNIIMVFLTVGVMLYLQKRDHIKSYDLQGTVSCLAIGFALGLCSAFLGIGGGPINLAVLYFCFSMDTKSAALHSLYVILFSQISSLASTFLGGTMPQISAVTLTLMIVGGVSGGLIGRSLSGKMTGKQVDRLFFWLLWLIIAFSVYNVIKFALVG